MNKNKEEYYAILSSDIDYGGDYNFLLPLTILEGAIDKDKFISNLGEKYLILDNKNVSYVYNDHLITKIISKDELNNQYNGNLNEFYQDYCSNIYYRKIINDLSFSKVRKIDSTNISSRLRDAVNKKVEHNKEVTKILDEDLASVLFYMMEIVDNKDEFDLGDFNDSISKINSEFIYTINNETNLDSSVKIVNVLSKEIDTLIKNIFIDKNASDKDKKTTEHFISVLRNYHSYLEIVLMAKTNTELINFVNNFNENDFFMSSSDNEKKSINILKNMIPEEKKERLKFIKDLKSYLDKHVIGQDSAKISVIMSLVKNAVASNNRHKLSCLLYGSTGTGKTFIPEVLCKHLNIPFVVIDTTQISAPGFVGNNIEDSISQLLNAANNNLEAAQHGVVIFDEIDKKLVNSSDNSVSGKNVLNQLLAFIQGTTYNLNANATFGDSTYFNTSNLTVFMTGAFQSLIDEMDKNKKPVGFSSQDKNEKKEYSVLEICDKVGLPKELAGRIGYFTKLNKLTKEDILKIINTAEDNAYNNAISVIKSLGIDIKIEDNFLDEVADEVSNSGLGARALNNVINKCIDIASSDILFNNDSGSNEIVLNANLVKSISSKKSEKTFAKKNVL